MSLSANQIISTRHSIRQMNFSRRSPSTNPSLKTTDTSKTTTMMRLVDLFGLTLLATTFCITGGFVPTCTRVNGFKRIEKHNVAALFSAMPQLDNESNEADTTDVAAEAPPEDESEQQVAFGSNLFGTMAFAAAAVVLFLSGMHVGQTLAPPIAQESSKNVLVVNKAVEPQVQTGKPEADLLQASTSVEQEARLGVEQETQLGVEQEVRMGVEQETQLGVEQETRLGVEQDSRLGIEQEARKSVEQETRLGVEQETRMGVEQAAQKGVEQEARKGVEQETRKAVEQETQILPKRSQKARPEAVKKEKGGGIMQFGASLMLGAAALNFLFSSTEPADTEAESPLPDEKSKHPKGGANNLQENYLEVLAEPKHQNSSQASTMASTKSLREELTEAKEMLTMPEPLASSTKSNTSSILERTKSSNGSGLSDYYREAFAKTQHHKPTAPRSVSSSGSYLENLAGAKLEESMPVATVDSSTFEVGSSTVGAMDDLSKDTKVDSGSVASERASAKSSDLGSKFEKALSAAVRAVNDARHGSGKEYSATWDGGPEESKSVTFDTAEKCDFVGQAAHATELLQTSRGTPSTGKSLPTESDYESELELQHAELTQMMEGKVESENTPVVADPFTPVEHAVKLSLISDRRGSKIVDKRASAIPAASIDKELPAVTAGAPETTRVVSGKASDENGSGTAHHEAADESKHSARTVAFGGLSYLDNLSIAKTNSSTMGAASPNVAVDAVDFATGTSTSKPMSSASPQKGDSSPMSTSTETAAVLQHSVEAATVLGRVEFTSSYQEVLSANDSMSSVIEPLKKDASNPTNDMSSPKHSSFEPPSLLKNDGSTYSSLKAQKIECKGDDSGAKTSGGATPIGQSTSTDVSASRPSPEMGSRRLVANDPGIPARSGLEPVMTETSNSDGQGLSSSTPEQKSAFNLLQTHLSRHGATKCSPSVSKNSTASSLNGPSTSVPPEVTSKPRTPSVRLPLKRGWNNGFSKPVTANDPSATVPPAKYSTPPIHSRESLIKTANPAGTMRTNNGGTWSTGSVAVNSSPPTALASSPLNKAANPVAPLSTGSKNGTKTDRTLKRIRTMNSNQWMQSTSPSSPVKNVNPIGSAKATKPEIVEGMGRFSAPAPVSEKVVSAESSLEVGSSAFPRDNEKSPLSAPPVTKVAEGKHRYKVNVDRLEAELELFRQWEKETLMNGVEEIVKPNSQNGNKPVADVLKKSRAIPPIDSPPANGHKAPADSDTLRENFDTQTMSKSQFPNANRHEAPEDTIAPKETNFPETIASPMFPIGNGHKIAPKETSDRQTISRSKVPIAHGSSLERSTSTRGLGASYIDSLATESKPEKSQLSETALSSGSYLDSLSGAEPFSTSVWSTISSVANDVKPQQSKSVDDLPTTEVYLESLRDAATGSPPLWLQQAMAATTLVSSSSAEMATTVLTQASTDSATSESGDVVVLDTVAPPDVVVLNPSTIDRSAVDHIPLESSALPSDKVQLKTAIDRLKIELEKARQWEEENLATCFKPAPPIINGYQPVADPLRDLKKVPPPVKGYKEPKTSVALPKLPDPPTISSPKFPTEQKSIEGRGESTKREALDLEKLQNEVDLARKFFGDLSERF